MPKFDFKGELDARQKSDASKQIIKNLHIDEDIKEVKKPKKHYKSISEQRNQKMLILITSSMKEKLIGVAEQNGTSVNSLINEYINRGLRDDIK